ncbi:IucA/IucC family siderophore biosynthesis protein [Thalassococcus sp. S3]|uniref:IucA/IucC family protein n=1 Tax=Thalassococcus sp. S3 TaxID=2017482 RepID=UPI00102463AD|nr:IucA/IucC family protein [Thalassococcus sp. S3]QBF33470.1 IucA/IucC family protein [Thalassococcus sp. S3]
MSRPPLDTARRRLLAKMISELSWEEVLHPEIGDPCQLRLASGHVYRFQAIRRIWDNLDIDPDSLSVDAREAPCPLRFVMHARAELGMSPDTEAMFLRELSNTLRQDMELQRLYGDLDAHALITLPTRTLHATLEGHPKAVANKGRLGWGTADLAAYAPEHHRGIRLFWLAADPDMLRSGQSEGIDDQALLDEALGTERANALRRHALEAGAPASHVLLPVHPWQWRNHLAQAFVIEVAEGRLFPLGEHGPDFVATPSLRTLTPVNGGPYDVKLSLGILNTSAWRGMPGKYIEHGGALSDWLTGLVQADPLLCDRVTVLREVLGHWAAHPVLSDCPDAPYRHHEMLGAIWRENACAKVGNDRRAVMAGALFRQGACGRPLAQAFAEAAGISMSEWLKALFEVTVVPLWHMLCRYGVGFIAHGQNITVVLENHVPVAMALKDFQGDLDLVDQDFPEMKGLDPAIRALLPRKPPAYIIHDIQTAHFVTVLRFLSAALARAGQIEERPFYELLREVLLEYRAANPDLANRHEMFDLFAAEMPKVCINKVRLAVGYGDAGERPLPARGTDLANPLALSVRRPRTRPTKTENTSEVVAIP